MTKLSRFHAKDRQDLQILCDSGELDGDTLRNTLDSAFAFSADEDEAPKRKKAVCEPRDGDRVP